MEILLERFVVAGLIVTPFLIALYIGVEIYERRKRGKDGN